MRFTHVLLNVLALVQVAWIGRGPGAGASPMFPSGRIPSGGTAGGFFSHLSGGTPETMASVASGQESHPFQPVQGIGSGSTYGGFDPSGASGLGSYPHQSATPIHHYYGPSGYSTEASGSHVYASGLSSYHSAQAPWASFMSQSSPGHQNAAPGIAPATYGTSNVQYSPSAFDTWAHHQPAGPSFSMHSGSSREWQHQINSPISKDASPRFHASPISEAALRLRHTRVMPEDLVPTGALYGTELLSSPRPLLGDYLDVQTARNFLQPPRPLPHPLQVSSPQLPPQAFRTQVSSSLHQPDYSVSRDYHHRSSRYGQGTASPNSPDAEFSFQHRDDLYGSEPDSPRLLAMEREEALDEEHDYHGSPDAAYRSPGFSAKGDPSARATWSRGGTSRTAPTTPQHRSRTMGRSEIEEEEDMPFWSQKPSTPPPDFASGARRRSDMESNPKALMRWDKSQMHVISPERQAWPREFGSKAEEAMFQLLATLKEQHTLDVWRRIYEDPIPFDQDATNQLNDALKTWKEGTQGASKGALESLARDLLGKRNFGLDNLVRKSHELAHTYNKEVGRLWAKIPLSNRLGRLANTASSIRSGGQISFQVVENDIMALQNAINGKYGQINAQVETWARLLEKVWSKELAFIKQVTGRFGPNNPSFATSTQRFTIPGEKRPSRLQKFGRSVKSLLKN